MVEGNAGGARRGSSGARHGGAVMLLRSGALFWPFAGGSPGAKVEAHGSGLASACWMFLALKCCRVWKQLSF